MNTVRLGVIGCGGLARGRADALQQLENQEVVIAMDIVEEHARAFAEKAGGIRHTTNLNDVLDNDAVDAVYIATPHASHAPLCIAAAEHGKHVLVEKPIATVREDALKMIESCRSRNLVLGIGYNKRFYGESQAIRDLVAQGAIGRVLHTRCGQHGFKEPERYRTWRGDVAEAGGGQLFDNGTHFHDVTRFMTGLEIEEVYAHVANIKSPVGIEDYTCILFQYKDSPARGVFELTGCTPGAYRFRIGDELIRSFGVDIMGTEGQIFWDGYLNVYTTHDVEGLKKNEWTRLPWKQTDVTSEIHSDFVNAVLTGGNPRATGEDGLATVDFVLSVYESARQNAPVKLQNPHLS